MNTLFLLVVNSLLNQDAELYGVLTERLVVSFAIIAMLLLFSKNVKNSRAKKMQ